jgi:hypothetical protein
MEVHGGISQSVDRKFFDQENQLWTQKYIQFALTFNPSTDSDYSIQAYKDGVIPWSHISIYPRCHLWQAAHGILRLTMCNVIK